MAEMVKLGGLVALEGNADLIATQLLFLPPSTKILIMPPLADDIETTGDDFDAKTFVRDVHTAFKNRSETARSFLECSADGQPRLAFLNGGCISAAAICILAICENQTNGDITKAEALFQEIVGEGVSGLMAEDNVELSNTGCSEIDIRGAAFGYERHKPFVCPSLTAMRAADALDRETADLQHFANDEIGDEMHSRTTSNPGSSMGRTSRASSQDFHYNPYIRRSTSTSDICATRNATPMDTLLNAIDTTLTTIRSRALSLDATLRKRAFGTRIESPSCYEETLPRSAWSPDTDLRSSQTATPSVFEFGTYPVDVQSTHQQLTRSISLDHRHSRQFRRSLTKRRLSCDSPLGRSKLADEYPPSSVFGRSTHTSCIEASKTTTEKAQSSVRHYVDRGTYAEDVLAAQVASEDNDFEPVFPMMEDLIIQLRTDGEDRIFDDTSRSYKNFSYPVILAADDESLTSRYSTSSGLSPLFNTHGDNSLSSPITERSEYNCQHDDIDPYSSESYHPDNKPLWSYSQPQPFLQPLSIVEPPTPAATPPPMLPSRDQRFSEIRVTERATAVEVQDSLRGILDNYFPPTLGYSQYQFPSEDDRFWKRVLEDGDAEEKSVDLIIAFGCDEGVDKVFYEDISAQVERLGTKKSGISRTGNLDIRYLIVNAMQTFTNQPLSLQTQNPLTNPSLLASLLIPHLESYLSMNSSSRFLVISFPAKHLATMLELRKLLGADVMKVAGIVDTSSYHSPLRPTEILHAEHIGRKSPLRTIQMGPTTSVPARSPIDTDGLSLTCPRDYTTTRDCEQSASFGQADFLLPSTTTAIELDNFLSRITKCLVLKSDFYTPEIETPKPTESNNASTYNQFPVESSSDSMQKIEAPPKSPDRYLGKGVQARQAPRARGLNGVVDRMNNSSSSKAEQVLGYDATSEISRDLPSIPSPSSHLIRSSPSAPVEELEWTQTDASGNREREVRGSADTERYMRDGEMTQEQEEIERDGREKSDKEWEKFDMSKFEEDSEDEIERMLMPQPQIKRRVGKGNSRKALKWLGLA